MIVAKAGVLNGPLEALPAVALSGRAALQWLRNNNYKKVWVESDSLLLVTTVNNDNSYHSTVRLIIQDYKELLKALQDNHLVFTKRSAN